MAMLSGKWTLKAIGLSAGWEQRITISGSNAHDGTYIMTLDPTDGTRHNVIPHVEGSRVNITAQAQNASTGAWIESLVQEIMNWDNGAGLQIRLNIDDNPPHGDLDFNDLVILCIAENNDLASPIRGPRPDLTIPKQYARRQ